MEIWKDIKNFDGYKISNLGNTLSFKRSSKGILMKNIIKKDGYLYVNLMQGKEMKQERVHRLVAEHFLNNEFNKPFVNHLDLNKTNNAANNLEWVSGRENVSHFYNTIETTSKYTGVYKKSKGFAAKIVLNKKSFHLGTFKNEDEANNAYQKVLKAYNECTFEECLNVIKDINNSTKKEVIKNLCFCNTRKNWIVSITKGRKPLFKGRFSNKDEAILNIICVYKSNNIPLHQSHKDYLNKTK